MLLFAMPSPLRAVWQVRSDKRHPSKPTASRTLTRSCWNHKSLRTFLLQSICRIGDGTTRHCNDAHALPDALLGVDVEHG